MTKTDLFPNIENFITSLESHEISDERKQILAPLVTYIQEKADSDAEVRLNFICTHNSRRSHLSQIWAQTMAAYYGIKNVSSYSGGTENTAVYPMVIKTLQKIGFKIEALSEGKNPVYSIKMGANQQPIIAFSKKFDADFNPASQFAAIMTCNHADEGCPFIAGAEKRIPITYDDPKAFDDTPLQAEKYLERSAQIASELGYVFSKIKR